MQPGYKNAFRCKKCPQSNGPDGCPVWTEITMTNTETGAIKIEKDCGFQHMPMLMVEVIKASNRPAQEISAMREQVVDSYSTILARSIEAISNHKTLEREH